MSKYFHLKPQRDIRMSRTRVIGDMPDSNRFESTLERDFMELVRFDDEIHLYHAQPVVIEYKDPCGIFRTYTPDGLVEYKKQPDMPTTKKDTLIEVKSRYLLKKHIKELRPKFRAAKEFASNKNWDFKLYTEREIRTPFLSNVKFLWSFLQRPSDAYLSRAILDQLIAQQVTTPNLLISSMFEDKLNQASIIPPLWKLIAQKRIGCNLEKPLNMNVDIWNREEI